MIQNAQMNHYIMQQMMLQNIPNRMVATAPVAAVAPQVVSHAWTTNHCYSICHWFNPFPGSVSHSLILFRYYYMKTCIQDSDNPHLCCLIRDMADVTKKAGYAHLSDTPDIISIIVIHIYPSDLLCVAVKVY